MGSRLYYKCQDCGAELLETREHECHYWTDVLCLPGPKKQPTLQEVLDAILKLQKLIIENKGNNLPL